MPTSPTCVLRDNMNSLIIPFTHMVTIVHVDVTSITKPNKILALQTDRQCKVSLQIEIQIGDETRGALR